MSVTVYESPVVMSTLSCLSVARLSFVPFEQIAMPAFTRGVRW